MSRARRTLLAALALGACVSAPPAPPPAEPVTPPSRSVAAAPAPRFAFAGPLEQGALVRGQAPAGTRTLLLQGATVPMTPDGRFVIGLDRDAPAAETLVAVFADGSRFGQTLAIAPRAWDISRLDTLPKYPLPSAEFARLRPAELAQIRAARANDTGADGWAQAMVWPATGRISTLFGSQRIYKGGEKGAYHSGIDIAVPTGTPVRAPADGVVTLAADHPFTLEGNLLMVDHGLGLNSAFLHLSHIDVKVGDHVRQGQVIAESGATGRATGPHLHWSLEWHGARLDPLLVAGPMPGS